MLNNVNCAAVFYGIPSSDLADPKNVKIPVQLHFGKHDDIKGFSSPEVCTNFNFLLFIFWGLENGGGYKLVEGGLKTFLEFL